MVKGQPDRARPAHASTRARVRPSRSRVSYTLCLRSRSKIRSRSYLRSRVPGTLALTVSDKATRFGHSSQESSGLLPAKLTEICRFAASDSAVVLDILEHYLLLLQWLEAAPRPRVGLGLLDQLGRAAGGHRRSSHRRFNSRSSSSPRSRSALPSSATNRAKSRLALPPGSTRTTPVSVLRSYDGAGRPLRSCS